MAGDWIKMRSNLWDDPRVARLCDLTDANESTVIGGLYWLWSTADQHSEDGCMPGLTPRSIDRKTGIPGFAAALIEIDWLQDDPQGVVLKRFEEHNGASAKKRAVTAKRVATHRGNAEVTHAALQEEEEGVTGALAREREREEKNKNTEVRTDVGGETRASVRPSDLSAAMRRNSIEAQPGDPRIVAAAEAGISVETIEAACAEAKAADPVGRIKAGFVVAIAQRWTSDAAKPPPAGRSRPPQHRSYHDERADTIAALTGRSRRNESDDRIVDVEATRLA
jgi:hypothetical protein